jgi:hypothetical protein
MDRFEFRNLYSDGRLGMPWESRHAAATAARNCEKFARRQRACLVVVKTKENQASEVFR